MIRTTIATLLIAAVAGLTACGGGDASSSTTTDAGVQQYCDLVAQLSAASNKIFSKLRQGGAKITPAQLVQAEREFDQQNATAIDELQRIAPAEIQADVAVSVAASRGRAGLEANPPSAQAASAADGRLRAYRLANCPGFDAAPSG